MPVRLVALVLLLLTVMGGVGCANRQNTYAVSTVTADDWVHWKGAQSEPGWSAPDRETLTAALLAIIRDTATQAGGEPVSVLPPLAFIMVSDGTDPAPLGAYPLDAALWGSPNPEDRARALSDLGARVRRDATGKPIAVFIIASAWVSPDSTVAPSESSNRQRTLVAVGLCCDGTRVTVMQPADVVGGDAFLISVPATDTVSFDDAATAADHGGQNAFFYRGYFGASSE